MPEPKSGALPFFYVLIALQNKKNQYYIIVCWFEFYFQVLDFFKLSFKLGFVSILHNLLLFSEWLELKYGWVDSRSNRSLKATF